MKLKSLLLMVLVVAASFSMAQSQLDIEGTSPNLHLTHTVVAKETWYSLGRMYNLAPKEIAAANGVTIDKPLSIGEPIKIPLTSSNFSQTDVKASDEVFVPLYHTVQEKEWMYRISVNHNKVPIETLERWNNISRDEARAGTKLIVGYLKVKQSQSPLAAAPASGSQTPAPAIQSDPPLASGERQPIPPEKPKRETATEVSSQVSTTTTTADYKGGYFRSQYDESGKSANGISGVFKSTSGWNDGKYYALMNNVPTGTIVKVVFPSTNKSIYAKVLGELPEMRESAGLTIRISDAAASELGAGNVRFTVDVKY